MAAATQLMWRESYSSVTIDDICTEAKVKKGSFYYFFESKVELAVAALESLWTEQWKPILDTHFSASVEPLKRITNYLTFVGEKQVELAQQCGKVLGCPACSMGAEVCTHEDKVTLKVREILQRKRRYYESAIRDAVADGSIPQCDPAAKTACLVAMIEGVTGNARIMGDATLFRRLPEMALEVLNAKRTAASPATPATTAAASAS